MQAQETLLEINLKALEQNVQYLKSKLKPQTFFMAVVKANSYGSGASQIAIHLQKSNLADYFAVAYAHEGTRLRQAGVTLPIMVLHPQEIHFQQIIENKLEPTLYSQRILKSFLSFAEKQGLTHYPVHIKCNSGMNRLGFSLEEIQKVCKLLAISPNVEVRSAYSHLAASEDKKAREAMLAQISKFTDFKKVIEKSFPQKIIFHMCNTSGILNYPEAHFDMVRSGIGMYGFGNDPKYQPFFRPIMSLKSIVSQIHTVEKGEFVGYNFGFVAQERTRVATIPVGHADGLNRIYGKGAGFVFINGEKAPIIGNVCMDMLMADVTHISCQEGDQVILFNEKHTAEALSEAAQTIAYELITSMSLRIQKFFRE